MGNLDWPAGSKALSTSADCQTKPKRSLEEQGSWAAYVSNETLNELSKELETLTKSAGAGAQLHSALCSGKLFPSSHQDRDDLRARMKMKETSPTTVFTSPPSLRTISASESPRHPTNPRRPNRRLTFSWCPKASSWSAAHPATLRRR